MLALLVVSLAAAAAAGPVSDQISVTTYNEGKTAMSGEIIFEDNFDKLDMVAWQHENTLWGGGNWEFEGYNNNRTNSFVRDGVLFIKPTLTAERFGEEFLTSGTLDMNGGAPYDQCTCALSWGCSRTGTADNIVNPIMSAALRTPLSFSFTYGTVEVRAKMPSGDWIWPAIWMMPVREAYGKWPTSGEVDIVESRGNSDLSCGGGPQIGNQQIGSTLHWGPDFESNQWALTHYELNDEAGFNADFHIYKVDWTPDGLTFSLDGTVLGTAAPPDNGFWGMGGFEQDTWRNNPWEGQSKMAPFDQPFYLKFNVAVGGTGGFFPEECTNSAGESQPWSNVSPHAPKEFWEGRDQWLPSWNGDDVAMQVDYIRVTAL